MEHRIEMKELGQFWTFVCDCGHKGGWFNDRIRAKMLAAIHLGEKINDTIAS